jgi:glucosyl-3-phosphoglycerate synthase
MARDIAKTILRTLTMEGVVFPAGFYTTLRVAYLRTAQDAVRGYHDDAAINGLKYDRHVETAAVEMFVRALGQACEDFQGDPLAYTGLPNWSRVTSAVPEFLDNYRDAIDSAT